MKPDYKFSDFFKSVIESFSDNGKKKVLDENLAVQNQFATNDFDTDVFSRASDAIRKGPKDPEYAVQKSAILKVFPFIKQAVSIFDSADVYTKGFFSDESFKIIHTEYVKLHRDMRNDISASMLLNDNNFSDFIAEIRNTIFFKVPQNLNSDLSNPLSNNDINMIGFLKGAGSKGYRKIDELTKFIDYSIHETQTDIYNREDIDNFISVVKPIMTSTTGVDVSAIKNLVSTKQIPEDLGLALLKIAYYQNVKQIIAKINKNFNNEGLSSDYRELYFYIVGTELCNNIDLVMHAFVTQLEYLKAFAEEDYDLFSKVLFDDNNPGELTYSDLYHTTSGLADGIKDYGSINGISDDKLIQFLHYCRQFFFCIGELTDLLSGKLGREDIRNDTSEATPYEDSEDEDLYDEFKEKIRDAKDEYLGRSGKWEEETDDPLSPLRIRFEDELEVYERMKKNLEKSGLRLRPEGTEDIVSQEELVDRDYRELASKLSGVRIVLMK